MFYLNVVIIKNQIARREINHEYCLSPYFSLATALQKIPYKSIVFISKWTVVCSLERSLHWLLLFRDLKITEHDRLWSLKWTLGFSYAFNAKSSRNLLKKKKRKQKKMKGKKRNNLTEIPVKSFFLFFFFLVRFRFLLSYSVVSWSREILSKNTLFIMLNVALGDQVSKFAFKLVRAWLELI